MSEISAERTYYVQTSLMFTDMTREVLFKVFRFLIDTEDIAGFLSLPDQQNKLLELRQQNILNENDYNLVSGHILNPERFDISLLIRLILNVCKDKIKQPKLVRKSKPQPKDDSLGADLYRLRDVRNKIIGHRADASLSEAEYEHTWEKVKAILLRVIKQVDADKSENFEQRLDEYKLLNIDTEDSRVKKLMAELLEYQHETEILQEKVEELTARSNELQVYFKTTPEQFVRYIKLLFEGGRIVLCGILDRVLGDRILSDLLVNHQNTLEEYIDEVFFSFLFPEESITIDHRTWDIYLLALVLLLVFKYDINRVEVKYIERIKEARLSYANCALSSLDTNKFLSKWIDLVNSLNRLSINIPEEDGQRVEHLIEVYKEKDEEGGNAEEYFQQLQQSGVEVKSLKDVYKETIARLKDVLRELNEKGVQFKEAHELEMKMLTTCENEEIRKKAEDLLEINLQASLQGLPHDIEPIRIETDKLVASVAAHSDVKSGDVIRRCIIWSFKCSTPCGLLHILDYFDSDQFRCTLQNIARELYYMYGYVFFLQGHFTLESLSRHPMLKGSTEKITSEHISIPLKCTSVDGIKSVLSELKQERTTNILNKIAEQISAEVKETVSIKVFPDIMEFQDVIDDTESEGSSSFGKNEEEDVLMVSGEIDQRHQISFPSEQGYFESNDKIAQYEDTEMYRKLSLEHVEVVMGNESTCNSGTAGMNIETSTGTFSSIDIRKEPTNKELEFGRQNLHRYTLDDAVLMQENESHGKYVSGDTKKTGWKYDTKEMLTTKGIDEKDERTIETYYFSTESEGSSYSRRNEEDEILISDKMDQRHQKSSSSNQVDSDHAERENVESSDKLAYKHIDNEAYKNLSHGHEEIETIITRKLLEDEVGNESACDSGAIKINMETNTSIFPTIDVGKMSNDDIRNYLLQEATFEGLEFGRQNLQKYNLESEGSSSAGRNEEEDKVSVFDEMDQRYQNSSSSNQVDNDHAEIENVESSYKFTYEHEDNEAYKKLSHGREDISTTNTRNQFEDEVEKESTCDSGATKMNMENFTSIFPSIDVGKEPSNEELEFGRQNVQKYNLDDTNVMHEDDSRAKDVSEDIKKTDCDTEVRLTKKEHINEKREENVEKYDFSTVCRLLKEGLIDVITSFSQRDFSSLRSKVLETQNAKECSGCRLDRLLPAHTQVSWDKCPLGQNSCNCLWPNRSKPCPVNFCSVMHDEIIKRHRFSSIKMFEWCSDTEWHQNDWELTQHFIEDDDGPCPCNGVKDLRCIDLLDIMTNNVKFQNEVDFQIDPPFDVLSQIRSYLLGEEYACREDNLNEIVNDGIKILTDEKTIYKTQSAQKAVRDLQRLNNDHQKRTTQNSNVYIRRGCQRESDKYKALFKHQVQQEFVKERKVESNADNHGGETMASPSLRSIESHSKEVGIHEYQIEKMFCPTKTSTIPIQYDHSADDFDQLLIETQTTIYKMLGAKTQISESELLTMQDQIEYLTQTAESFKSTTFQNTNLDKVRKDFLHIKDVYLSQQRYDDGLYVTQRTDFFRITRRLASDFLNEYRLEQTSMYLQKDKVIPDDWDIFFQNGKKSENIIVIGSLSQYKHFCNYLLLQWLEGSKHKYDDRPRYSSGHTSDYLSGHTSRNSSRGSSVECTSSGYSSDISLDDLLGYSLLTGISSDFEKQLATFKYLFILSLEGVEEIHIHDMIKQKLLARKSRYLSIFEQILFRESEKCLIILQGLDKWKPDVKTLNGSTTQTSYILPKRSHTCNYVVIVTIKEKNLEKMKLGDRDKLIYLNHKRVDTLRKDRMMQKFARKMVARDISFIDELDEGVDLMSKDKDEGTCLFDENYPLNYQMTNISKKIPRKYQSQNIPNLNSRGNKESCFCTIL